MLKRNKPLNKTTSHAIVNGFKQLRQAKSSDIINQVLNSKAIRTLAVLWEKLKKTKSNQNIATMRTNSYLVEFCTIQQTNKEMKINNDNKEKETWKTRNSLPQNLFFFL